jgi:hypothetical protein
MKTILCFLLIAAQHAIHPHPAWMDSEFIGAEASHHAAVMEAQKSLHLSNPKWIADYDHPDTPGHWSGYHIYGNTKNGHRTKIWITTTRQEDGTWKSEWKTIVK